MQQVLKTKAQYLHESTEHEVLLHKNTNCKDESNLPIGSLHTNPSKVVSFWRGKNFKKVLKIPFSALTVYLMAVQLATNHSVFINDSKLGF